MIADNTTVKNFWEKNPVAAKDVAAEKGTLEFFQKFDALREAPNCEPPDFSNKIHGFDSSAGKKVLDVGCGNGYVLSRYAAQGATVHGLDLTEQALALSRKRFDLVGLKGAFELTDGDKIPCADDSFDVVCSMGVLHHIADPRPMIREMQRVLRPGGQLILMFYHKNSFRNAVAFRLRKYVGPPIYRGKDLQVIRNMNDGADCPLALVYSKAEVSALLSDFFHDLRFTINKLPYEELFLSWRLGARLAGFLPSPSESFLARRWGWNLYVKAVKK
jgi:SAM-dependent methyltransferase